VVLAVTFCGTVGGVVAAAAVADSTVVPATATAATAAVIPVLLIFLRFIRVARSAGESAVTGRIQRPLLTRFQHV
jgi:spore maturation protein SpmA